MRLLVIVYVEDMARSVAFYEALGLKREAPGDVDAWWNAFTLGDATLALHHNGGAPLPPVSDRMHLNLDLPPDGSLDIMHTRCQELGLDIGAGIDDVGFGRFFWVRDPDGLPVQFNERVG